MPHRMKKTGIINMNVLKNLHTVRVKVKPDCAPCLAFHYSALPSLNIYTDLSYAMPLLGVTPTAVYPSRSGPNIVNVGLPENTCLEDAYKIAKLLETRRPQAFN